MTNGVKTSKLILVILGVFALVFITTMIVIFCVKGSIPDTLVTCVLGGTLGELISLASIKVAKVVTRNNTENIEHRGDDQNESICG